MVLHRDPVVTRSHNSWKNLATCFGRFCVQKRTEEGLSKNSKLRHRWFYVAEDLFPFRIIYSTHPSDFNDALPPSPPIGTTKLYLRGIPDCGSNSNNTYSTNANTASNGENVTSSPVSNSATSVSSSPSVSEYKASGVVDSLLHWWSGNGESNAGRGSANAAPIAAPTSFSNFFSFSPFSNAAGPMERYTVATSTQLSGILEAWGLLLEAWAPEEAELNVLSFASPTTASLTPTHASGNSNSNCSNSPTCNAGIMGASASSSAVVVGVPFFERWRRTYSRIGAMCAESGMNRRTATASYEPLTPLSPWLDEGVSNTSQSQPSPLNSSVPASRLQKSNNERSVSAGGDGGDVTSEHANTRSSFASRRHVHISDDYHYSPDSPAPIAIAHFFDVLLVRVVDLLMWRDPQLTACCLGILVSIYGHTAWANALCYLAGETLSSSSVYCTALYHTHTGDLQSTYFTAIVSEWVASERLWWGAPLFTISVLAYPWTGEQQRRAVTLTDRERLRSVDQALRWLSATTEGPGVVTASKESTGEEGCSFVAAFVDVAKRVCAVLRANRLPISFLLLFNIVGAFSSWEAIWVLFLWPMLIVSVSLSGIVVVVEFLRNQ